MKTRFFVLALLLASVAVSCDDDDYTSSLPTFSDITFSEETLYTNQEITATAVQSSKGRLLDRTTYSWTISDDDADATLNYNSGVVYDDNPSNPSCTFTTPSYAGTFTIQLYAKYNISGQSANAESYTSFDDGSATYSVSALTGSATVVKSFKVVAQ